MGESMIRSLDELIERNNKYRHFHIPQPLIPDIITKNIVPSPFVIIGCMDPRADPAEYFGLNLGDCVVIRNAGGRANQSVVNDILMLDSMRGITDVVIMHHKDCGMTYFTNEMIREAVKKRNPENRGVDSLEFGEIKGGSNGLQHSVRDDMKYLADSPYFAAKETPIKFHGFILDIETGEIQKVQEEK